MKKKFATEWYLRNRYPLRHQSTGAIYQPDRELRLAGRPGGRGHIIVTANGRAIFDTSVELDAYGFRKVTADPPPAKKCIFIMGGSLAFGLGLNQDETVAYYLQQKVGSRARVINLGFEGYGPQHVLRILESGREREAAKNCRSAEAYNLGIVAQVTWAAGRKPWVVLSPRYLLKDGEAVYAGQFRSWWLEKIGFQNHGKIVELLARLWADSDRPPDQREIATYRAIMRKTRNILRDRYHGGLTDVIFTIGNPVPPGREIEVAGIPLIHFEALAQKEAPPGELRKTYYLEDGHLNRAGSRLLAGALQQQLEPWLAAP